jgi:crossover junction endodeoxyribonuclease RuvC
MKICSCDVGSKNFSISVIDFSKEKGIVLHNKTYVLTHKHIGDRMSFILKETNSLINQFSVDILAYESPFFRSGHNVMPIYWVTGTLQMSSAFNKLPIYAYSATEVKKVVAGTGKADKLKVEAGVRKYLSLNDSFVIKDDHSSDSLAVGITCFKALKLK